MPSVMSEPEVLAVLDELTGIHRVVREIRGAVGGIAIISMRIRSGGICGSR